MAPELPAALERRIAESALEAIGKAELRREIAQQFLALYSKYAESYGPEEAARRAQADIETELSRTDDLLRRADDVIGRMKEAKAGFMSRTDALITSLNTGLDQAKAHVNRMDRELTKVLWRARLKLFWNWLRSRF